MTDATVTFQGWGRAGWGEQAFGEGSASLVATGSLGSVTVQANANSFRSFGSLCFRHYDANGHSQLGRQAL
jgi:hypothetical protein